MIWLIRILLIQINEHQGSVNSAFVEGDITVLWWKKWQKDFGTLIK